MWGSRHGHDRRSTRPRTDVRTSRDARRADAHRHVEDTGGHHRPPRSAAVSGGMRVRKRSGALEPVDVNKIVNAIARALGGPARRRPDARRHPHHLGARRRRHHPGARRPVDPHGRRPHRRGAQLLQARVAPARHGHRQGGPQPEHPLVLRVDHGRPRRGPRRRQRARASSRPTPRTLNAAIDSDRDRSFEFFGLRTVYDRYLLRHPQRREVIETPQYFFLRVACGLVRRTRRHGDIDAAVKFYDLMSSLAYLPSSPTLFNSGTVALADVELLPARLARGQPRGHLQALHRHRQAVEVRRRHRRRLAPGAGQGLAHPRHQRPVQRHRAVAEDARLARSPRSTRAAAARARRASTSRRGTPTSRTSSSCATTPATTPAARTTSTSPTGSPTCSWSGSRRTGSGRCSTRKRVPHLTDLYGAEFEQAYLAAEEAGLYEKQVPARQLYRRMMRTLAQTGNGWITFKDASNEKCNQTGALNDDGSPASCTSRTCAPRSSRSPTRTRPRCATSARSTSAPSSVRDGAVRLRPPRRGRAPGRAVPRPRDRHQLLPDRRGRSSRTHKWRPVGLGLMGLQDVFFKRRLPFDSADAKELSQQISDHIYFHALWASTELAEVSRPARRRTTTPGPRRATCSSTCGSATARRPCRRPSSTGTALRARIAEHGLRNSLLIAIAPTATIASIAGCYECIEPQVSNLFKRETLSGEFLQINRYLVTRAAAPSACGTRRCISEIKRAEGSVQDIERHPGRAQGDLPHGVGDAACAR